MRVARVVGWFMLAMTAGWIGVALRVIYVSHKSPDPHTTLIWAMIGSMIAPIAVQMILWRFTSLQIPSPPTVATATLLALTFDMCCGLVKTGLWGLVPVSIVVGLITEPITKRFVK